MGELAASIAHELNNALATISPRIESLLSRTDADHLNHRPLTIVEQEVERMAGLVANLLQFSWSSAGPQISTVDVRDELEMLRRSGGGYAGEKWRQCRHHEAEPVVRTMRTVTTPLPMSARVLVVDDEVELMTVLCELLAERWCETAGCAALTGPRQQQREMA